MGGVNKMNKKSKIIIAITIVIIMILGVVIYINVSKNDSAKNNISQKTQIVINVFDKENTEIYNKTIETEKNYLADVLETLEDLDIVMEEGQYGKYITSILGIAEEDSYYWSYYINDEYASVGVSSCEIEENSVYSFKIEKYEY